MTIHYGKRNPGALTAASPGDTIYIPLNFYNDSGASVGIGSSLAAGDIEVFKNGSVTQRATDSGYAVLGDTGNFDNRIGFKGISVSLFNTADDASFYAVGSTYWVAVDSVTVDGRTVRFFPAVFEIGEQRANLVQLGGDTGAANWLKQTFAAGFADTGINQRLAQIQSDVDTGLRTHINDLDTGLHDTLADYDTGVRGILITTGVNLGLIRGDTGGADRFYRYTQKLDTGGDATVSASVDTGLVNQSVWQADAQRKLTVDTGIADQVWMQAKANYTTDTGTFGEHLGGPLGGSATVDTGIVNQAVWQGNAVRSITDVGDTGIVNSLQIIRSDVDTGLRAQISDVDTGLHDALADYDTGIRALLALRDTGAIATAVWAGDTGLRDHISNVDTGLTNRLGIIGFDVDTGLRAQISDVDTGLHDALADYDTGMRALVALQDTGAVSSAIWNFATRSITNVADTGIVNSLAIIRADTDTGIQSSVNVTGFADTGINDRLAKILADTDTGLKTVPAAIKAKTDSLTFTVAGAVDANIEHVNATQIQGTGDTGTNNTWRPI